MVERGWGLVGEVDEEVIRVVEEWVRRVVEEE